MSPGAGKCLWQPWRIPVIPAWVSKGAQPGLGRNLRRRWPKHGRFIRISALCPSGTGLWGHSDTGWYRMTQGDTRWQWHTVHSVQPSHGFMQTCSSGCGSRQKEGRREIPKVGVPRSLAPAALGPGDYSNLSVTITALDRKGNPRADFTPCCWELSPGSDGGGFWQGTDQAVQGQYGISGWLRIPTRMVAIKQL